MTERRLIEFDEDGDVHIMTKPVGIAVSKKEAYQIFLQLKEYFG